MAVITSLLWCPGGWALTGHWEYHADSHGPCCPAAPCSCWQTLSCHLRCCRCCAFSYNTAETRRFKANHNRTYQINYGTNTGAVKIPDSKRESVCTDTRFTSLLQSKLSVLSFRERPCNTRNSLWIWLFATWSRTIKRHLFYTHRYQKSKWFLDSARAPSVCSFFTYLAFSFTRGSVQGRVSTIIPFVPLLPGNSFCLAPTMAASLPLCFSSVAPWMANHPLILSRIWVI